MLALSLVENLPGIAYNNNTSNEMMEKQKQQQQLVS